MAGRRKRFFEFGRYPTYQRAYIRAFDRMLSERAARGKDVYKRQPVYFLEVLYALILDTAAVV